MFYVRNLLTQFVTSFIIVNLIVALFFNYEFVTFSLTFYEFIILYIYIFYFQYINTIYHKKHWINETFISNRLHWEIFHKVFLFGQRHNKISIIFYNSTTAWEFYLTPYFIHFFSSSVCFISNAHNTLNVIR